MSAGRKPSVRTANVGSDPRSPERGNGLGLASMRERVQLLNGTFAVDSGPGRGTAVIVLPAFACGKGGAAARVELMTNVAVR